MANEPAESPALPILGSALLAPAEAREKRLPGPASSGAAAIDDAGLEGGFRYGEVTSIAGAGGTGKTLLSYHAIASHLLTNTKGEAALIDTTGTFSPVRLRDVLVYRLRAQYQRVGCSHSGFVYENKVTAGGNAEDVFEEEAIAMLDRVKVMRVFDLAGVVEAVGEVGEMRERCEVDVEDDTGKGLGKSRYEVGDSEEESEDEILQEQPGGCDDTIERTKSDESAMEEGLVGMVIIDAITNVASSVVSKSPIQGQALLAYFMRSVQHLTSRHQTCTILINSAVGLNPSTNPEYHRRTDDNVSIFSSAPGKPALGKAYTYFVDTSIFLAMIPKTREDASVAYGDRAEGRTWQKAIVLEVLKDRHGTREGRWIAFEIAGIVKLVPFFT